VESVLSGEVNQKASKYADILAEDKGNVSTGNYINGQKGN
jgi:hypothetical protein